MARGRMLNTAVSSDYGVAELSELVGPWGVVFWTWTIPHLDKHGRIHGDPRILKGKVCPLLDQVTREVIQETLTAASQVGLIRTYSVGGVPYVEYPKFAKNQVGLRVDREPDSGIPPPTSAGNDPEDCRQTSGNDPEGCRPKLREEKLREENNNTAAEEIRQPSGGKDPHAAGVVVDGDQVGVDELEKLSWGRGWLGMTPKQKSSLDKLAPFTAEEVRHFVSEVESASGRPNWGLFASKVGQDRDRPEPKSRGSPKRREPEPEPVYFQRLEPMT